jgi:hypothetical protein
MSLSFELFPAALSSMATLDLLLMELRNVHSFGGHVALPSSKPSSSNDIKNQVPNI